MDVTKLPCHICGGTDYEIGQPTYEVMKPLYLYKHGATIQERFRDSFKIFHSQDKRIMAARRCLTCQNVQLFMDLPAGKT
jgi:hypothetical protein